MPAKKFHRTFLVTIPQYEPQCIWIDIEEFKDKTYHKDEDWVIRRHVVELVQKVCPKVAWNAPETTTATAVELTVGKKGDIHRDRNVYQFEELEYETASMPTVVFNSEVQTILAEIPHELHDVLVALTNCFDVLRFTHKQGEILKRLTQVAAAVKPATDAIVKRLQHTP